jgi:hypothetical protein
MSALVHLVELLIGIFFMPGLWPWVIPEWRFIIAVILIDRSGWNSCWMKLQLLRIVVLGIRFSIIKASLVFLWGWIGYLFVWNTSIIESCWFHSNHVGDNLAAVVWAHWWVKTSSCRVHIWKLFSALQVVWTCDVFIHTLVQTESVS